MIMGKEIPSEICGALLGQRKLLGQPLIDHILWDVAARVQLHKAGDECRLLDGRKGRRKRLILCFDQTLHRAGSVKERAVQVKEDCLDHLVVSSRWAPGPNLTTLSERAAEPASS
jgi:hypothetical protein